MEPAADLAQLRDDDGMPPGPRAFDRASPGCVVQPGLRVQVIDPLGGMRLKLSGPPVEAKQHAGRPAGGAKGPLMELRQEVGHPVAAGKGGCQAPDAVRIGHG